MSVFSSNRERRLWACVLAVIVAIYATLGLARTLADALRDTGVGESLFVFCFLLVLTTIATQGFRSRPRVLEMGVALGVAAAYLLVFARMAVPTERSHLIEYGVVAIVFHEALRERAENGRRVPFPAVLAVLATGLFGVVDECIQAILPSRVFDSQDMWFNVLAGVMAVAASMALRWARQRGSWLRGWRRTTPP